MNPTNYNIPDSKPVNIQPIVKPTKEPKIKKSHKFLTSAIIILIIIVILSAGIAALFISGKASDFICKTFSSSTDLYKNFNCNNTNSGLQTFEQKETVSLDKTKINTQEDLITQIVDTASPSVVTISATTEATPEDIQNNGVLETQPQNIGSGFIVREDGIIVTNSHVVEDLTYTYNVILSTDKTPIPVKNIYRDSANDIAIVVIDKKGLPALKLGNSDSLKRGNTVVAIGSPLGDLTGTVTSGIVSGLNRDVTAGSASGNTAAKKFQGVVQIDAAINPGNSGGPLLNTNAEVVGINFATNQGAENISFALPINRVKAKLDEFQKNGKLLQPYIGIAFTQRTYYLADTSITGALISQVQAGTPAEKGGLQKGDIVVTANGKSLEDESFQNIIQTTAVGAELKLSVYRKGSRVNLTIIVGDKSDVTKSAQ